MKNLTLKSVKLKITSEIKALQKEEVAASEILSNIRTRLDKAADKQLPEVKKLLEGKFFVSNNKDYVEHIKIDLVEWLDQRTQGWVRYSSFRVDKNGMIGKEIAFLFCATKKACYLSNLSDYRPITEAQYKKAKASFLERAAKVC